MRAVMTYLGTAFVYNASLDAAATQPVGQH